MAGGAVRRAAGRTAASTGLMLGAGHGGLEVFGVGLLQLVALISYVC